MSLNNARKFVVKLREDPGFRNETLAAGGPADLLEFLDSQGLVFDQLELIGAMAECMQQLETREAGR